MKVGMRIIAIQVNHFRKLKVHIASNEIIKYMYLFNAKTRISLFYFFPFLASNIYLGHWNYEDYRYVIELLHDIT